MYESPSNIHGINLKTSTIYAKRLILVAWLGPESVSADKYITVVKIQAKYVKMEDK